jgi:DNA-binding transcriptional LysR family regulator
MEFIWLEDFLALVDSGNFSRAAELRHVTQPAFSRRIRALEDWVGVDLFERDSHPVTLTEAGHRFRPVAEELLRRLLQGREEARQADHNAAAKLKFAVTHALLLKFFSAWLHAWEAKAELGAIHLFADNLQTCENAYASPRGRVSALSSSSSRTKPTRTRPIPLCPSRR